MQALLVSTYDMGRQPFGLASPAAWLRRAGVEVHCVDVSRQPFRPELTVADLVAFYLPMHTATRLALPLITQVRDANPDATLCCYGLYAPPNEKTLVALGVDVVLGAEFEADLVALATGGPAPTVSVGAPTLPRLEFVVPDRHGLPPPSQYAALHHGREQRVVGYTEASRGCKHWCRHCPVVPIYKGQFRVVPSDVVLEDIRQQVGQGAQHITFGDPDFFNGVGHAMPIVESLARELPGVSYDVTIKVEHLLRHRDLLPRLRETGCAFVTSAVESFDDEVLERLDKGHTADDARRAIAACRDAGLPLMPTFVAFTPWTSFDGYLRLLDEIHRLSLVEHVAPIQLAIRLLVSEGSGLLELPDLQPYLLPFSPHLLTYPWQHPDRRVDRLQAEVAGYVNRHPEVSRWNAFEHVWDLAQRQTGTRLREMVTPASVRAEVPFLNEPWYC